MDKENKLFDDLEKYQDIWQKLYQEYIYAFKSYTDFISNLKSSLAKINVDNTKDNITRELCLNYGRNAINDIIYHNLQENKIDIILNYINNNINLTDNSYQELIKLVKWFNEFEYIPGPNIIISLIEQSMIFKNLLQKLVEINQEKIRKYDLSRVFDNDIIVLFIEIYSSLNNIDLEDNNESLDFGVKQETDISDVMLTGVDAFISEIRRKDLNVLTKEEEYELLIKIKNGDQEAYNYFYEHNCRLVISIAKKYRNSHVEYEDLLQEGGIGLMIAIDRFEIERGLKFSTYATWWIRQAIIRAINKYGKKTGVSIGKNLDLIQYKRNVDVFADELGRNPNDEEIAKHFNLSLNEVQENNRLLLIDYSINQKVNDEDSEEFGNFIEDKNTRVESEFIINNLVSEVQELFIKAGLTKKEIAILNYRWGLNNCEEKTLTDLGRMFGFTRERARQSESIAIKKLRKYVGTKDFALYLDNPDKDLERLTKLIGWHYSNPKSFIIYDIDVDETQSQDKGPKEFSWKTKKNRKINCLYEVFKSYKREDIDAIIETLSEEEKKIIEIRNDYYNNPTVYSAWNNETIKKYYSNIISKIRYRLNAPEKKVKISTIYNLAFCHNYSKEEINLAIYMLDYQDKELIKLRYGTDLDNPVISSEWDFKKHGDIFYEEVIPHIRNNLKIIYEQNQKIEEKIMVLSADVTLDKNLKEIYIKALKLLKILEIKLLLQEFSAKEAIVLALYLLQYFEGITFNIEDFINIIGINKEGLNECVKKSLLFMKNNLEAFTKIKNELYYCDNEKKLSRK